VITDLDILLSNPIEKECTVVDVGNINEST